MLYSTNRVLSVLKCQEQPSLCRFLPLTSPLSSAPLLLLPNPGLRGGKGGFGSLLRAIGAQVHFSILWFEMLCLNVLLFRLRQQPTMRPWGTWPAGGSVMSTMREGSKSKCSIYLHHFWKLNHMKRLQTLIFITSQICGWCGRSWEAGTGKEGGKIGEIEKSSRGKFLNGFFSTIMMHLNI